MEKASHQSSNVAEKLNQTDSLVPRYFCVVWVSEEHLIMIILLIVVVMMMMMMMLRKWSDTLTSARFSRA